MIAVAQRPTPPKKRGIRRWLGRFDWQNKAGTTFVEIDVTRLNLPRVSWGWYEIWAPPNKLWVAFEFGTEGNDPVFMIERRVRLPGWVTRLRQRKQRRTP